MLLDQIEQVIHQSPGLTGTQIAHILFGIGGYHQRIGHACQALVEAGVSSDGARVVPAIRSPIIQKRQRCPPYSSSEWS